MSLLNASHRSRFGVGMNKSCVSSSKFILRYLLLQYIAYSCYIVIRITLYRLFDLTVYATVHVLAWPSSSFSSSTSSFPPSPSSPYPHSPPFLYSPSSSSPSPHPSSSPSSPPSSSPSPSHHPSTSSPPPSPLLIPLLLILLPLLFLLPLLLRLLPPSSPPHFYFPSPYPVSRYNGVKVLRYTIVSSFFPVLVV